MNTKKKRTPASVRLADSAKPPADRKVLEARVIKTDELYSTFVGYMINPDEVLRDTGEAFTIYREMKTDARVKSLLSVAKAAILNYPLRLERGEASDAVMAVAERAVGSLPLYEPTKRLLSGIDYGYAVVELVWKNEDGWWLPDDAVLRRPERFSFDADGRLKYRRLGELVDLYGLAYKWLVYRHDKDAENPYGTPVLKACYWPWKFKKAGLEFWLMACERFSVPSILALFESTEGEDKLRDRALAISDMLSQMSSGSGAALANVKDVKTLELTGALSEFRALMDWCDTQIAYGIVQQSLAVQEAQNGTRAQAQVHEDVFLATAKLTARELASVLQSIIAWTVELNFGPGQAAPIVAFDLADHATFMELMKAIELGVPVSRSSLYERYGLPEPEDEDDAYTGTAQGAIPPAPAGVTPAAPIADVQATALNGAQVASLVNLAAQVSTGNLPLETARAIAAAAFPLVDKVDIDAIFNPLVGFTPTVATNLADDIKKKPRERDRLRLV
jgi:phage gp29-like protein